MAKNNYRQIYFVSGIDTDVGKTLVSAVLCQALEADYWKPIQAGDLGYTDTDKVKALVSNANFTCHPERFRLKTPASPHYAAALDKIDIKRTDFNLPNRQATDEFKPLIVEGAGGLLVPINNKHTILDIVKIWQIPLILVVKNYLGSINHSLLSIAALKQYNINLAGLIISGKGQAASEEVILEQTGTKILCRIPQLKKIDANEIENTAILIKKQLIEGLRT